MAMKSTEYLSLFQLKSTAEYIEYSDLKLNVDGFSNAGTIGSYQRSVLQKFAKAAITVNLMSNSTTPKANLVAVALVSLLYAVLAAIALLLSGASAGLYVLSGGEYGEGIAKYAKSLVSFTVIMLPCYLLLMLHAAHFSYGSEVSNFADRGVSLSFFGIVLLIASAISIVGMCAMCFTYLLKKESNQSNYALMRNILALGCLVIAMFSIFLPVLSVQVAAEHSGEIVEETFYLSAKEIYEISDVDMDRMNVAIKAFPKTSFEAFIQKAALSPGSVTAAARSIFYYVAFRYSYGTEIFCVIMGITYLLGAYIFALFILRMISHILHKKEIKHKRFLMFTSVFFSALNLAFAFAMSGICNAYIPDSTARILVLSVSAGPIVSLVATLAAVASLLIRDKQKQKREFDNPDVSYDPYVI